MENQRIYPLISGVASVGASTFVSTVLRKASGAPKKAEAIQASAKYHAEGGGRYNVRYYYRRPRRKVERTTQSLSALIGTLSGL